MLIGLSLSLMVMAAILSSYVFLARNFTRSLGVSYAVSNQTTLSQLPPLEAQLRTTLAYFAQDVRMATGISGTPSADAVTLTLPTASGTTTVTYAYDAVARTLTRTWSGLSGQIIHRNLLGCTFSYFDASGNPYTTDLADPSYGNYLPGIKQLSVAFTAQGGSDTNRTLTQVYTGASPRLLLRNRSFLP